MNLKATWQDVQITDPKILYALAERHALHPSAVQDCLDPAHYPKIERFGDTAFLILRYCDPEASAESDTLLSLTRKMAFFFKDKFLLTVHRGEAAFLKGISGSDASITPLLGILKGCLDSYKPLLDSVEKEVEEIERNIFSRKLTRQEILRIHRNRSKLSVLKRLMMHTTMVMQNTSNLIPDVQGPWIQDLKETSEAYFRIADEMMEDVQNLLELQISLAAQRTNEVMRFLTVVSLFFLPLTFIVGVYGMNFRSMPELSSDWGYPGVWLLMILVSVGIYRWVRRSGWLSPE
ncbi:MAG: hypothetical protein KGQ59_05595 [Bdellovibrionales bacterium]|nr:hypothetical protein [Bdellovibrionales bacterium]